MGLKRSQVTSKPLNKWPSRDSWQRLNTSSTPLRRAACSTGPGGPAFVRLDRHLAGLAGLDRPHVQTDNHGTAPTRWERDASRSRGVSALRQQRQKPSGGAALGHQGVINSSPAEFAPAMPSGRAARQYPTHRIAAPITTSKLPHRSDFACYPCMRLGRPTPVRLAAGRSTQLTAASPPRFSAGPSVRRGGERR